MITSKNSDDNNSQVHNSTAREELAKRFEEYRQRAVNKNDVKPNVKNEATPELSFNELSDVIDKLIKLNIITDEQRRAVNNFKTVTKRLNVLKLVLAMFEIPPTLVNDLTDSDFEIITIEQFKREKAKKMANDNPGSVADVVGKIVKENEQIKRTLETTVKKSYEDEIEATQKYNVQIMSNLKASQEAYKLLDAQHKKLSEEYEKLRLELQELKKNQAERPISESTNKDNWKRNNKLVKYINEIMSQNYSAEKKQFLLNCLDVGMPYKLVKNLAKQDNTQSEMDMLLEFAKKTY